MASRSVHVTFLNKTRTNEALELENKNLDHGVWSIEPADLVGFSDEWESESNGFFTGTEGSVTFIIPDVSSTSPKMRVDMHWDNPFLGCNSYSASVVPAGNVDGSGFSVGFFGSKRGDDNAEVTFVLLSGKCQINPDNGEITCTGISAVSTEGELYAGIWEKHRGPPWQARHGMTSTQYQQIFNQMIGNGFRLVQVSGYNLGNADRYAAIWEKTSGPPFQARHGLTAAQYQQTFNELLSQGFRLTYVSGYGLGNEDRYAAIWEQRDGPPFQARHGLSATQYQQTFNELLSQGFRLILVNGYSVGNEDRYAAIWEQRDGPPFQARHGLNANQYQQTFDELLSQGFRLIHVSGYRVGNEDHYAAIWEQKDGVPWQARHRLGSSAYQQTFNQLLRDGFRLINVSGYNINR